MILDKIFGIEERATVLVSGAQLSQDGTLMTVFGGGGGQTKAGASVTEDSALTFSAVYSAVSQICTTLGFLPVVLYEREGDGGDKRPARDNPLYSLVHDTPNPYQTPLEHFETSQMFVLLWGWHPSYIERNGRGLPVALWPMRTNQVKRGWVNGRLCYDITHVADNELFRRPPTNKPVLFDDEVLEVSTFNRKSIVTTAREQIGEALAAQDFGGGFFAGGAQPYFVIEHPARLSQEAIEKLRTNWQKRHGSAKRDIGVLDEGMKVNTVGMPLTDAQFLESRKFAITEIARWFNMPPHKLKDLERATFSNIEEQQLEWFESLLPWMARREQVLGKRLLTAAERKVFFFAYMPEGLLRGNIQQRYDAYSKGILTGFMTLNEARRRENWNSFGPEGDVKLIPANMTPLASVGQQPAGGPPGGAPPPTAAVAAGQAAVRSAIARLWHKEREEVREAAKEPGKFTDWLDRYYVVAPKKAAAALTPAVEFARGMGYTTEHQAGVDNDIRAHHAALVELTGRITAKDLAAEVRSLTQRWGGQD